MDGIDDAEKWKRLVQAEKDVAYFHHVCLREGVWVTDFDYDVEFSCHYWMVHTYNLNESVYYDYVKSGVALIIISHCLNYLEYVEEIDIEKFKAYRDFLSMSFQNESDSEIADFVIRIVEKCIVMHREYAVRAPDVSGLSEEEQGMLHRIYTERIVDSFHFWKERGLY